MSDQPEWWILDEAVKLRREPDLATWSEWLLANADACGVASDEVGDVLVLTAFAGEDPARAGDFDNTTLAWFDPTQVPTLITALRNLETWWETANNGDILFKCQPGS
jgi:hypothetical protein